MPRGNWRLVIAAFGIAIAASSNAQPVEQNTSGQAGAQNRDQRPSEDPAIAKGLSRIASALEADVNDPKAEEDRQRAKDDLKAQQDMATYTALMAGFTLVALILSAVGIVLIYVTFKQTRIASKYAGIGLRHSRRGLSHMQRVAQNELRPYLAFTSTSIGIDKTDTPVFEVSYKNFGQVPAYGVRILVGAGIGTPPCPVPDYAEDTVPGRKFIAPGQELGFTLTVDGGRKAANDALERIEAGEILIVNVAILYDVHGIEERMTVEAIADVLVADKADIKRKALRIPIKGEIEEEQERA